MGDSDKPESKTVRKINIIVSFFKKIGTIRNKINHRMEGKYSAKLIALCAAGIAAVIMVIMLFLPNYLGVADDGSVSRIMNSAGVYYLSSDVQDNYNNYFVKTYSNVLYGFQIRDAYINSQVLIVKAAVLLDDLLTGDVYFDIRFLGLIYGVLYVPAIYLLIKQACTRVKKFSEGIAIGFLGVLIFADVAYITYFNSFYPEAVWYISLMYCVGAALSFQNNRTGMKDFLSLLLFVVSGIVLITSRKQTACIGILLAVFSLKLLFARKNWMWGVICTGTAVFLTFLSLSSMLQLESDFTDVSKFHAMTRGVLFESDNPGKTLKEFGIDQSYEMLTDVSAYDYLPFVESDNEILTKDFLNQYDTKDVALYYVRHPASFLGMLDVSIKSCFGIRREYCGNYEKSVGLPQRARSIFFCAWSTFKNNTAPKTIGFLLVLVIAIIMLYYRGYSLRPTKDRRNTVFLDMMVVLLLICISQAAITIINSGDAEMVQHCFLVSYTMDIMIFYSLSEIVHKINIF